MEKAGRRTLTDWVEQLKRSDFPPLYQAADTASVAAQKQYFRVLASNFALLVVAAAMSVINYPHASFAVIHAAVLAGSLSLVVFLGVKQPQKVWYDTRALAESIKTVTWRYVMRAEPFNIDDEAARSAFILDVRKIFQDNKEVSSHAVEMPAGALITQVMTELRGRPLEERRTAYRAERIGDQKQWYADKAKLNRASARRWFVALIGVNILALGSASLRIQFPSIDHWPTDIFVAAAASLMGWVQTKRFHELSSSYTLTAHEIVLLDATLPNDNDEARFSSFIGDAENAFSREHTQWRARRDIN